jgi:hypothetical protein
VQLLVSCIAFPIAAADLYILEQRKTSPSVAFELWRDQQVHVLEMAIR